MRQRGASMPRKSTNVMKIKTNAKEAGWYASPQCRRQTQREFARALKNGTLIRSAWWKIAKSDSNLLKQLMEEAKRNATRSILIRDPTAALDQARPLAEKPPI